MFYKYLGGRLRLALFFFHHFLNIFLKIVGKNEKATYICETKANKMKNYIFCLYQFPGFTEWVTRYNENTGARINTKDGKKFKLSVGARAVGTFKNFDEAVKALQQTSV